jgi:endonuclease/exonuclease/phosphatase family metal-dependent hydrolase
LTRRPALAAALVAAALAGGCASAVNYLDPAGPLYRYEASSAGPTGEAATAVPPPPAAPFRVVTFNIAYGVHVDRALEALRASVALRHPDLLALQEMDPPGVERVARELGLNAVYFPSGVHPKSGRDFGCALLSPWPLEEPRKLVLPHAARGTRLRRSAVSALVVRGAWRVRAYSVHLPSPLGVSGGSRRQQVWTILADVEAAAGAEPVVVAGDFNSHGVGELFVRAGYAWHTRRVGATAHWALGGLSYDHVFTRGLTPAQDPLAGAAFGVSDNRDASDHRPVWVLLEQQARTGPPPGGGR